MSVLKPHMTLISKIKELRETNDAKLSPFPKALANEL